MEHPAAAPSRARLSAWALACPALVCALVPPEVLAGALRAAGALTLEAQPFVALAALAAMLCARANRHAGRWAEAWRSVAWAGGCGCTGPAGALTPAAFIFCAFTAGWPLAVIRALCALAAAVAIAPRRRFSASDTDPGRHAEPAPHDGPPGHGESERYGGRAAFVTPARQLAGVAAAGFAGALLLAALETWHAPAVLGAIAPLVEAAAGALFGLLSPCTLGAVGLAATLRTTRPAFAAGLLATAGVLPPGRIFDGIVARAPWRVQLGDPLTSALRRPDRGHYEAAGTRAAAAIGTDSVVVMTGLALAATLAASRSGAGIVSPRLTPLLVLGAAATLALCATAYHARLTPAARPRTASVAGPGWLLAATLTVALAPAPFAPPVARDGAALEDAVAGGRVDFTGVVTAGSGPAGSPAGGRLARWRMTCCIADAAPVVVALAAPARASPGTWVRVRGIWRPSPRGLVLRVQREVTVPPPRDPYLYA